MSETRQFAVGLEIIFDADLWTVVDISAGVATLRNARLGKRTIMISELLADESFKAVESGIRRPALAPTYSMVRPSERRKVLEREAHIRECLTGYKSGDPNSAQEGEPRAAYDPQRPLMDRYHAKAQEMGISLRTLQRYASAYKTDGLAGLMDLRGDRQRNPFGRVDSRWVEMARLIMAESVNSSQKPKKLLIEAANQRCLLQYPDIKIPSNATALRVLNAMSKGKYAFTGQDAKAKRSVAGRPTGPYTGLRCDRVGEYIMLDTTPLDVHALSSITGKWVSTQLTVAIDVYSRCVVGLRLTPVSAKAVDAAVVLREFLDPRVGSSNIDRSALPYGGLPSEIALLTTADSEHNTSLPSVAADSVVIDHGKMYVSDHVRGICERLGISIQPAHVYSGTDKAIVERFFGTLSRDLLVRLSGYKGPDVKSRGQKTEDEADYFVDELEELIRRWVIDVYHVRSHRGLQSPHIPHKDLSPIEAWTLSVERTGLLTIPADPDLFYDFLPIKWRTIQHYGIEVNGCRYNADVLLPFHNMTSSYRAGEGKWPIRYDPEDVRFTYFQHPDDFSWHKLTWELAHEHEAPFSVEAYQATRELVMNPSNAEERSKKTRDFLEQLDSGRYESTKHKRIAERQRAIRSKQEDKMEKLRKREMTSTEDELFPGELVFEEDAYGDDEYSLSEDMDPENYYNDAFGVE